MQCYEAWVDSLIADCDNPARPSRDAPAEKREKAPPGTPMYTDGIGTSDPNPGNLVNCFSNMI